MTGVTLEEIIEIFEKRSYKTISYIAENDRVRFQKGKFLVDYERSFLRNPLRFFEKQDVVFGILFTDNCTKEDIVMMIGRMEKRK